MNDTIIAAAKGAWLALDWADLNGLPIPFDVRLNAPGEMVEMRFASCHQVVTWAEPLDTEVVDSHSIVAGGSLRAITRAVVDLHGVRLHLVANLPAQAD